MGHQTICATKNYSSRYIPDANLLVNSDLSAGTGPPSTASVHHHTAWRQAPIWRAADFGSWLALHQPLAAIRSHSDYRNAPAVPQPLAQVTATTEMRQSTRQRLPQVTATAEMPRPSPQPLAQVTATTSSHSSYPNARTPQQQLPKVTTTSERAVAAAVFGSCCRERPSKRAGVTEPRPPGGPRYRSTQQG